MWYNEITFEEKAVKKSHKKEILKISKKKLTSWKLSGILFTVTKKEVKKYTEIQLKKLLKKVKEKVDNQKWKWYINQRHWKDE